MEEFKSRTIKLSGSLFMQLAAISEKYRLFDCELEREDLLLPSESFFDKADSISVEYEDRILIDYAFEIMNHVGVYKDKDNYDEAIKELSEAQLKYKNKLIEFMNITNKESENKVEKN